MHRSGDPPTRPGSPVKRLTARSLARAGDGVFVEHRRYPSVRTRVPRWKVASSDPMLSTRVGAVLLAFFGVGCLVTGVAALADRRGIAVVLTSVGFGFLALLMAGRSLLDIADPPAEPAGRGARGTLLAIAVGTAVVGFSAVWRAFTEPVGVPAQVLFIIGGAGFLYGSFGSVIGVFYQSTSERHPS